MRPASAPGPHRCHPVGPDAGRGRPSQRPSSINRAPHASQTVRLSGTGRRHFGQWKDGGPAGGTVGGGPLGQARSRSRAKVRIRMPS